MSKFFPETLLLYSQDILPMYFEILERLSSSSNSFKHSFNTFISFPYVVGSCARGWIAILDVVS